MWGRTIKLLRITIFCLTVIRATLFFSNKIICLILVCFLIYEKLSEGSYYKDNNIQRILNN